MKRRQHSSRAPKSKAPPPPAKPRRRRSACPERSILDDEMTGTVTVRWTIDGSVVDLGDGWAQMTDARVEDLVDRIRATIGDYFADLADRGEHLKVYDGVSVDADLDSIDVTDGPVQGALVDILESLELRSDERRESRISDIFGSEVT